MALGPRLDLRQSQQLVMTPQLQQAIKLLTLTNLELEGFLASEIEKNPLLDTDDGGSAEPSETSEGNESDLTEEPATTDELLVHGDGASDAPLDVDYTAETFHHDSDSDAAVAGGLDGALGLHGSSAASSNDSEGFEALLSADRSLADVLIEQAGAAFGPIDIVIARHLIDLIDEAGYLTGSIADVAERLGVDAAYVEAVLKIIQTFEPTGVGARDLSECLMIQAREADRLDPAMAKLLQNLALLARGELATLRRLCNVDQEDLVDMIHELRTYNPKPGLVFGGEPPQPVVPDVYVAKLKDGSWAVELNSATLPRLLVNRSYYVELYGQADNRETKAFLSDCLASANWLTKALDQRARTIIKVATEIVRQQTGFFETGVSALKPLNLRTIAEAIGMHESTVSRVTSNKFLSCDRGVFEFKYFFTSGIQASDGEETVSSHAVKERLRTLIGAETAETILSDDKLVELLRGEGFDIARRTVAKYRESLGLGSSVQRRRAALLQGGKTATA